MCGSTFLGDNYFKQKKRNYFFCAEDKSLNQGKDLISLFLVDLQWEIPYKIDESLLFHLFRRIFNLFSPLWVNIEIMGAELRIR